MNAVQFKRRLRWLVVFTSEKQNRFIAELAKYGCRVLPGTFSKWLNENHKEVPDAVQLMAIGQIDHRVSMDYLLGRRGPESVTEKSIEERIH